MTMRLSKDERDFVESGGALWYARASQAGWQVIELKWDGETINKTVLPTEALATRFILFLAELAPNPGLFRILEHPLSARLITYDAC